MTKRWLSLSISILVVFYIYSFLPLVPKRWSIKAYMMNPWMIKNRTLVLCTKGLSEGRRNETYAYLYAGKVKIIVENFKDFIN